MNSCCIFKICDIKQKHLENNNDSSREVKKNFGNPYDFKCPFIFIIEVWILEMKKYHISVVGNKLNDK